MIEKISYVIMQQDSVQGGCPQPSFADCEHEPVRGCQANHLVPRSGVLALVMVGGQYRRAKYATSSWLYFKF